MTFARANAMGWGLFEILTSSQMNVVDSQLPYALDGRHGGNYTPDAGLKIDGASNASTDYTLTLLDSPTKGALNIQANNGSGRALEVTTTVNGNIVRVTGAALNQVGTPNTSMLLTGASNSGGVAGRALQGTGGASTYPNSIGGDGLRGIGGSAFVVAAEGGVGVRGEAGSSIFTGYGSARLGGHGVLGQGGSVVGANVAHYGGFGLYAVGGTLSGTGIGGYGVYGRGAVGPLGQEYNDDAGYGVVGRGYNGVLGVSPGLSTAPLPAEFGIGTIHTDNRCAVRACGKTYGRAFMSEWSGAVSPTGVNKLRWIGDPGAASLKTLLYLETDYSVAPSDGGTVIGLQMRRNGVSHKFRPIDVQGTTPSVFYSSDLDGVVRAAVQLLGEATPTQHDTTSFVKIDNTWAGKPTGLLDTSIFMGTGPNRAFYDRIVGSGDRCVAIAWGRFWTSGGGIVNGTNYGISTVAIGTLGGLVWGFRITLDTIDGQPTSASMVGIANNVNGYTCNVVIESSTSVFVYCRDASTGAVIDINDDDTECHLVIYGALSYGYTADRPTYFKPA